MRARRDRKEAPRARRGLRRGRLGILGPALALGVVLVVATAGAPADAVSTDPVHPDATMGPAAVTPLVPVTNGRLVVTPEGATVSGTVTWSASGYAQNLTAGEVRVVAVSAATGRPRIVATKTLPEVGVKSPKTYRFTVEPGPDLAALAPGNRVVFTATQRDYHPPLLSPRSYVTVHQLQAGPGEQKGREDCSDRVITIPLYGGPPNLDNCDLTGAVLSYATLSTGSRYSMQYVDLTGADLGHARLDNTNLAGGRLGGTDLRQATQSGTSFAGTTDPGLIDDNTTLQTTNFSFSNLKGATFTKSLLQDTTFVASILNESSFRSALFQNSELNFSRLRGAHLEQIRTDTSTDNDAVHLDLTDANLDQATITHDTSTWVLCNTTLWNGKVDNRDCPK